MMKQTEQPNYKRFTVAMTPEAYHALQRQAKRTRTSVSAFAGLRLEEWVAIQEPEPARDRLQSPTSDRLAEPVR